MQSLDGETLDDMAAQLDSHGELERNARRKRKRGCLMTFKQLPKWKRQLHKHK